MKKILIGLLIAFFSLSNVAYAVDITRTDETVQDNRYRFVYDDVNPGDVIEDRATFTNKDPEPTSFELFSVDAIVNQDNIALKKRDANQIAIGSWLKFEGPTKITLAPKEKQIVDFKITVPDNIAPGDYIGGILAQGSPKELGNGSILNLEIATGARIYLTIAGEIILDFAMDSLSYDSDTMEVFSTFSNNGNVSVAGDVDFVLKNIFGQELEYKTTLGTLLAGTDVSNTIKLNEKDLPPSMVGPLKGTMTVSYRRLSMNSPDSFPEETIVDTVTFIIWPPVLPTAAVLLIILSLVALLVYRHMLTKKLKKYSVSYGVKQGDTIQSIAAMFRVDWKRIAKVNKIKSPYFLQPNVNILIPVPPELFEKLKGNTSLQSA
jgi:hypothetical protein